MSDNQKIQPLNYSVISDVEDNTISAGYFKISGIVKMFSSDLPLDEVLVGCTSSGTWVKTGTDGKFEILLPASDSVVYFYKKGWSEIVMDDYDLKEGHHIEVVVYVGQVQNDMIKRKPVIYLYSDKDITANIELDPYGDFTFTYPLYDKNWEVEVKKDGGLLVNSKEYLYLFWEARSNTMNPEIKDGKLPGFLISSAQVIPFLEEKLTAIGFNQTEMTDFITYWGPILTKNKYAFIQFVVDEEYQSDIASIKIEPQPDAQKRIFILCSSLENADVGYEIIPQEFETFERKGFTVVEWGGSEIDLNLLKYEIGL